MTMLDEALAWHHAGYAPIPPAADGTKRPAVLWQDFIDDPPTPQEIRTFYDRVDTDGVGLLCGAASGHLEMLEVEGRAIGLADELGSLLTDHQLGDLWDTINNGYVEQTPSGGIHWYYRVDGPARRNTKLARRPATPEEIQANPAERLKVLIETRGEGGYTVIAPSAGRTHPSGNPWTILRGRRDTIPTITIDQRDALHAIATILDQVPATPKWEKPRATNGVPTEGLRPGDDYNTRSSWDDILGSRGWTKTKKIGPGWGWTRPGKKALDGISATTGTSRDGEDRLYVFSTSTEFETERPYSKFAAYTLLEHAGDYTAAARALGAAGYGTQTPPEPVLTPPPTPQQTARPQLQVLQGGAQTAGTAALAPRPTQTLERSEDGHSQLLVAAYGDLIRYCPQRSAWLAWDGAVWQWQPKGGGVVREYAKTVARTLPTGEGATAHKKSCSSARGIAGCLALTETDPRVTIDITRLDADPWTLNTPGGLVDLRTGLTRPPDPTALCTKMTAAAPDFASRDTAWDSFLADTFGGHATDLAGYVQRLAGITLIGTVREQLLAFLHGVGANGKSTLIEALMHALRIGEAGYAIAAPAEMLMIRKHSEHPAELAQLAGARMVVCSELDDGQRFAEARIKQLTGSDSINARFLYGQPFTFHPSHTFWLLGNHRPQARTGGMAFWRRVKLIEFTHIVPTERRDPALGDRLSALAGVVLAWAIRGAVDYFQHGIREPAVVERATQAYADDQDTVARFVDDQIHLAPGIAVARVPISDFRTAYERWCSEAGEMPVSAKRLTQDLAEKYGVTTEKGSHGRRFYVGITMLAVDTEDDDGSATEPATFGWDQ